MAVHEENPDNVSVNRGFPNAALDHTLSGLDLGQLLIKNPAGTFFWRVEGNSGNEHGIYHNDILVVDRTLKPLAHDLVLWWQDDYFCITHLKQLPKHTSIWGVITYSIHPRRLSRPTSSN